VGSLFFEILENWVNVVECFVDFLPHFSARQHDLARDEDEQNYSRFYHPVDKTGEQLRLVRAELAVRKDKTLEADGELNVARTNHVLNLKVLKLGLKCIKLYYLLHPCD
jgi:hypothetical protein